MSSGGRARDAMIPEPLTLEGSASAQEAGQHIESLFLSQAQIKKRHLKETVPERFLGAGTVRRFRDLVAHCFQREP